MSLDLSICNFASVDLVGFVFALLLFGLKFDVVADFLVAFRYFTLFSGILTNDWEVLMELAQQLLPSQLQLFKLLQVLNELPFPHS